MYAPNMLRFAGSSRPRLIERQSIMPRQVDYPHERRGNVADREIAPGPSALR